MMKCPSCGTPEKARVKFCTSCGEAYASEDLLELHQLEFLVETTAEWDVPESVRYPYLERLKSLRDRVIHREPVPSLEPTSIAAEAAPAIAAEPDIQAEGVAIPAKVEKAPSKEQVPFDQWLLSERNIKIALYTGGLLLVLAGLIFIGVNWTRIPGPGKFAITLLITGLMYLGGYLLFQRPAYKIGGIALIAVASGFLALNFAVLQIYVLGPSGLRDDVMWLIASPFCLLLYGLTAYWTRSDLFTYISQAAVVSTVTSALVVIGAPLLVYLMTFSLVAYVFLLLALYAQKSPLSEFTYQPLLIVSQLAMPLFLIGASMAWLTFSGCTDCTEGSPWLALLALGVGVLFYITTDVVFEWPVARWVAAPLFAVTCSFIMLDLNFSDSAIGIALMVLALALLGIGYALERREEQRSAGWPLYATAYVVAILVSLMAFPDTEDLAKILLGDVALLAISAAIFRNDWWVYGAVWLFMLPVYLIISLFVPVFHNQGLLMGLLGLNYAAVGYALGRRELRLGGPFLTAGAFLSVIAVMLVWGNSLIASIVLVAIAILYLLIALWIGWEWLLFPALFALNLSILTINDLLFKSTQTLTNALIISFAVLGILSAIGGLILRRSEGRRWAWPLYVTGTVNLAGAYLGGLMSPDWLAIGLSATVAATLLTFAWLERTEIAEKKLPPILTYLGLIVIFVGQFYVLDMISDAALNAWPACAAGVCAFYIALAWLLRGEPLLQVYSKPLRRTGLWLMAVPMVGSLAIFEPVLGAVTFAIAGIAYAADAALRRIIGLAYLSVGAFVVVIIAILMFFDVAEPQAYAIPIGLALLGGGWNERMRGGNLSYRLTTILGLFVLMGSAFVQSIPQGAYVYAILLGTESLRALGWGIYTRSRGYVQLGVLALFLNAIVQLGPSFMELPRWVQIGVTGSLLLGGGLAALFKREEILNVRQRLSEDWRQWEP
jgi:hypothetical protein